MHGIWFLEKSTYSSLRESFDAFHKNGNFSEASEIAAARESTGNRALEIVGDTAVISINGVLTPEYDWVLDWIYGNTAYSDLRGAVAQAESDAKISSIVFDISSPGGSIDGLFETMDALFAAQKPTKAVVSGQAASAAYGLASQAGEILATNDGAMFGSVGVVTGRYIEDDYVEITSTEAPNKRPDVKTEEGIAVVREELDDLHELFAGRIARGRETTLDTVNKNFGRGSMFVANKAEKAGMIDAVTDTSANGGGDQTASGSGSEPLLEKGMNLETLKAEHPGVYAEAKAEGTEEGVQKERSRVNAHLEHGEKCNAQKLALEFIESGAELGAIESSQYIQAASASTVIDGRKEDDQDLKDTSGANNTSDDKDSLEDQTLAIFNEKYGMGDI